MTLRKFRLFANIACQLAAAGGVWEISGNIILAIAFLVLTLSATFFFWPRFLGRLTTKKQRAQHLVRNLVVVAAALVLDGLFTVDTGFGTFTFFYLLSDVVGLIQWAARVYLRPRITAEEFVARTNGPVGAPRPDDY